MRSNIHGVSRLVVAQVRQGLLYVWGESGPQAEADSANTDPPVSSFRDQHDNSGVLVCIYQYTENFASSQCWYFL
jgi:hypothetical protein